MTYPGGKKFLGVDVNKSRDTGEGFEGEEYEIHSREKLRKEGVRGGVSQTCWDSGRFLSLLFPTFLWMIPPF